MKKLAVFALFFTVSQFSLKAEESGHCYKCEVMRKYNKEHPSQYTYYDDYLKALKEKGAENVNLSPKDLPPDVKYIMDQQSVGPDGVEKKKKD